MGHGECRGQVVGPGGMGVRWIVARLDGEEGGGGGGGEEGWGGGDAASRGLRVLGGRVGRGVSGVLGSGGAVAVGNGPGMGRRVKRHKRAGRRGVSRVGGKGGAIVLWGGGGERVLSSVVAGRRWAPVRRSLWGGGSAGGGLGGRGGGRSRASRSPHNGLDKGSRGADTGQEVEGGQMRRRQISESARTGVKGGYRTRGWWRQDGGSRVEIC